MYCCVIYRNILLYYCNIKQDVCYQSSNGMLFTLHFEKINVISVILICYLESERNWSGRCGGRFQEAGGQSQLVLFAFYVSTSKIAKDPLYHLERRRWRQMFSFSLRYSGINTSDFNRQITDYKTNAQITKELKNTSFGQINGIQEKLDTSCK